MYEFQFDQVAPYFPALVRGFGMTLLISGLSAVLGLLIVLSFYVTFGVFDGLAAGKPIRAAAKVYIDVNQALPVLVGLVWLYFCLPIYGVTLSAEVATVIVLGISLSAFTLDLVMSAEATIPAGQVFSATVHRIPRSVIFRRIYLPQIARIVADPFAGQLITLLKLSTFASIIGSQEILAAANGVIARTYRPMETYTLVALIFLVAITPVNLARRAVGKAAKHDVAG